MSKKSPLPQSRHHILVYDEDWDWLDRHYGRGAANSEVGISGAIKAILHQRVLGMRALANKAMDQLRDDERPTGDEKVKL